MLDPRTYKPATDALRDRIILITGASDGIGRSVAQAAAAPISIAYAIACLPPTAKEGEAMTTIPAHPISTPAAILELIFSARRHAASGATRTGVEKANTGAYPAALTAAMFEGAAVPRNPLFPTVTAPAFSTSTDATKNHPATKTSTTSTVWWYNSGNGIIRALIPNTGTTAEQIAQYNNANKTNITSMADDAPFPAYKDVDLHLIFDSGSPTLAQSGPFMNILEVEHQGVVLDGDGHPAVGLGHGGPPARSTNTLYDAAGDRSLGG